MKASLLFLRKKQDGEFLPENYPIFMSIADHIGYDATGRPDKNEFPEILEAYLKFLKGERSNFPNAPLCFVVERGELEGRVDPFYYKPEFKKLMRILEKGKYPLKELCDIIKYITDGSHYTPKYEEDGIPVLSAKNIFEDSIDFSNINYINKEEHIRLLNCSPQKNDILITKSGTIGRSIVVTKDVPMFNTLESIARFRVLDSINPHFISSFLNSSLGQKEIYRLSKGVGVPHLQLEKIKLIKIPIPPREIQDKIAQKMHEAYKIKKEKEAEAERLLNSIDDYVLGELHITLPELKDEKCFAVTFEQIKDKRLDPYYHQPKFKRLKEKIQKGKYHISEIKDIIKTSSTGKTPEGTQKYTDHGVPIMRIRDITEDEVSLEDVAYVSNDFYERYKDNEIKREDILLAVTGATIGKAAIWDKDVVANFCGDLLCLRTRHEILNHGYFHTIIVNPSTQLQINQDIYGATNKHLSPKDVGKILIPLPPLSVQERIAQEVKSRREQAKRLNQETKVAVEKAKEEVVRMILGKNKWDGGQAK